MADGASAVAAAAAVREPTLRDLGRRTAKVAAYQAPSDLAQAAF